MKNKFILEEVNRIHEIMGTSPKKLIKEGVDEVVPFAARFLQKLIGEAPDVADNLFTSVTQKSAQFADDLTNAGITNMEQLLARGTDDMLFDFFMNMNSLRLLDDTVVDIFLAMAKEGDSFVGPLISDIDKIIAAGADDAIEAAKTAVKGAGFSDNVVEQLFARAPAFAQKIIQMTPDLTAAIKELISKTLTKIQSTASFKNLPKEFQERLTLSYTNMGDDIITRIFGKNPSATSIQNAMFKEIDDLALQAKNFPNVTWGESLAAQISEVKKVIVSILPSGTWTTKAVLRFAGVATALTVLGLVLNKLKSGTFAGETGEAVGSFGHGLIKGFTDNPETETPNTNQNQNQNQNQNTNQNTNQQPKKTIDDY